VIVAFRAGFAVFEGFVCVTCGETSNEGGSVEKREWVDDKLLQDPEEEREGVVVDDLAEVLKRVGVDSGREGRKLERGEL
jgi:hypothetical protein